jgi:hypothetical protein
MDVTDHEIERTQQFLDNLLETTRKDAIQDLINKLRSQDCKSVLTLRYLELLLKEEEIYSNR